MYYKSFLASGLILFFLSTMHTARAAEQHQKYNQEHNFAALLRAEVRQQHPRQQYILDLLKVGAAKDFSAQELEVLKNKARAVNQKFFEKVKLGIATPLINLENNPIAQEDLACIKNKLVDALKAIKAQSSCPRKIHSSKITKNLRKITTKPKFQQEVIDLEDEPIAPPVLSLSDFLELPENSQEETTLTALNLNYTWQTTSSFLPHSLS